MGPLRGAWRVSAAALLGLAAATACSGGSSVGRPSAAVPTTAAPSTTAPAARTTTTTTRTTTTTGDGWQTIGTSVRGRPLRLRRVGTGPRTVLWVGGIHGDEAEGAVATAELPAAFTGAGLGPAVTLLVLEDLNPDGRAAGTRGNANGVDLNRNFPSRTFDGSSPVDGGAPLSQPESRALADLVRRAYPDLVLVAHAWRDRTFVNFDGPAAAVAAEFARRSGMPVVDTASLGAPTPGSLGSWVGTDLGTPILTIEYRRGSDPTTDWSRSRDAVLHAVAGLP